MFQTALLYLFPQQTLVKFPSFKNFFQNLQSAIRSDTTGKFRQSLLWSFLDRPHLNATALFKAIDRPGTDELMLIDVLCTATNEEIVAIKAAYDDGK